MIYKRKLYLEGNIVEGEFKSNLSRDKEKKIALKLYDLQKEEAEFRELYQEGDVAKSLTDLATTAYQLYRITNDSQWYMHNLNAAKKAFRLMKHTKLFEAIDLYLRVAKTGGIIILRERRHITPIIKLCDELIDTLETNPKAKKHPDYFEITKSIQIYRGEAERKKSPNHHKTVQVKQRRKKRYN